MTRQEMIDQLEEIRNELIVGDNDELTDHAKSGHIYLLTRRLNVYKKIWRNKK